jgi:hypothetical protein
MPDNAELISRLGSLRRTVINIKEITRLIGLQAQASLLDDDHHEVRSQWMALALELSHMSALADNVLSKVKRTKVRKKPIYVGGAKVRPDAGLKLEAEVKPGTTP